MRRRHLLAAAPVLLAAACAPRSVPPTVAVFFTADNAELDAEAQAVVRRVAQETKDSPLPVQVLGFAGPVGGLAYNRALSDARAKHVADLLIANGVAAQRVRIVARGPVPYESVPTESRRVEIRIGL